MKHLLHIRQTTKECIALGGREKLVVVIVFDVYTQIDCNKGGKDASEGMTGRVDLGIGMLLQFFQNNGEELEDRVCTRLTRVRTVAYIRR